VASILRRAVRFAVLNPLEFYGDERARRAFDDATRMLQGIGGQAPKTDFALFRMPHRCCGEGPGWPERMAAIRSFFERHADQIHPVVHEIIAGAAKFSATDLFQGITHLHTLQKRRRGSGRIPTAGRAYSAPHTPSPPCC
jgi:allophanate hydrolase